MLYILNDSGNNFFRIKALILANSFGKLFNFLIELVNIFFDFSDFFFYIHFLTPSHISLMAEKLVGWDIRKE